MVELGLLLAIMGFLLLLMLGIVAVFRGWLSRRQNLHHHGAAAPGKSSGGS